jgi:para-aminobenzoate synthetase component I
MEQSFSLLNLGQGRIEKLFALKKGTIYYSEYKEDILTGSKQAYPFLNFIKSLNEIELQKKDDLYRLLHLYYEAGHYMVKKISEDFTALNLKYVGCILAIDLEYEKSEINSIQSTDQNISYHYKQEQSSLTKKNYRKAFLKGREKLIKGECYQFNLTFPKYYKLNKELKFEKHFRKMINNDSNAGAYAHGTYLPGKNLAIFSNSPECLFQAKKKEECFLLWSMPIKGTIDNSNNETLSNWKKLLFSKKDEAELNMITDLLRNDLSRIHHPISKVIFKKKMLKVPGLLHQFSLIEVKLPLNITLGKILSSLFPGGSITGAPKINVMKILDNLEDGRERGFYTGSTILVDKNRIAASINIRSAEVNLKKRIMKVCAGGGITLLSEPDLEYKEMESKRESFLGLFI